MSDSFRSHELQHARPPCPSPTPGVYSNSCSSSQWCHPAISASVVPFSSCPQPLPASGSFPTSQLFAWVGQSIGVSASASVLPVNTQDWSPLGWTGYRTLSGFCGVTQDSCLESLQKPRMWAQSPSRLSLSFTLPLQMEAETVTNWSIRQSVSRIETQPLCHYILCPWCPWSGMGV